MKSTAMRRSSTLLCLAAVVVTLVAAAAAQRTPVWPLAFSVSFTTNNGTVGGKLYYDWALKAQRIDHDAGNYECQHFYNTTGPCSEVFNSDTMFTLIHDTGLCCTDLRGVGVVAPDWFDGAAYLGVEQIGQYKCDHWKKMHEFWTQVDSGLPCRFGFPGHADGLQDFYFDIESLVEARQPTSLFALAPACKSTQCPFH
eukprot:TRINITY_DN55762_c0_g1_i1.p1 TRINITY_DN55762_c0_g1~~TRINITY_DN55762_c0_g1_i1.p1  ORF type:complete len:198 (-),score=81.87 TRINITY_DN55762_c0_g1_i1:48-641(-)